MTPDNKNRLICSVHDDVIEIAEDIMELLEDDKIKKRSILSKLKKIISYTEDAKEKGQRMEKRLDRYKYGIENLGFKRDK
jgi:hypothetical protein